jgi:hypothetical protein
VAGNATRAVRTATRDVGAGATPAMDAEELGGALAACLLAGAIADGYDACRRAAVTAGRGLRLTLSLGASPALLSVPWELLYRAPTFLANQRQTPVVRHLDVPGLPAPPVVDGTVRILGVVANPPDTPPLDVAAERRRVEQAVAAVVAAGRVTLDWLEPATPRRLREVLRDRSYHVLHYVGHGDFTPAGEGVLYLETGADAAAQGHSELDSAELASLLADQESLRLVVLNACDGARTSLTDPFAGVATTLVQLGVPAVVAMQFAISDAAAILFAEELYTNLIGRQSSVDAAVSEARKAIYIEQGTVEWATPVLFMGDTAVELWRWTPVPDAPDAVRPPPPPAEPAPARPRRRKRSLVGLVVGVALLVAAAVVWAAMRPDDEPDAAAPGTTVTAGAPATTLTAAAGPPTGSPAAAAPPSGSVPPFVAQTLAGTIDAPGQVVPTTLDLVVGQLLYVHGTTACGPQVAYRVLRPGGTQYGGAPYVCEDLGRVDVDESGPWSLIVESYAGGTGPYALELAPIRPDTIGALEAGQPVTGEILDRGEVHRFRFGGAAGEAVYVVSSRAPGPCTGVVHQLFTAAGAEVGVEPYACGDIPRQQLPATGDYELVVSSWEGGVGTYSDTLVRIPPDVTEQIELGATVTGEITVPGQAFRYELTAAAGDALFLDGSGPPTTGVAYTLEGPDGRQVGPNPYADGELSAVAPATGTYTLVVASWSGGLGAYTITVTQP